MAFYMVFVTKGKEARWKEMNGKSSIELIIPATERGTEEHILPIVD